MGDGADIVDSIGFGCGFADATEPARDMLTQVVGYRAESEKNEHQALGL
jgi:hypothetical protein